MKLIFNLLNWMIKLRLMLGSINGHFTLLCKKLNAILKKTPIDVCFAVGNLFSSIDNREERESKAKEIINGTITCKKHVRQYEKK